MFILRDRTLGLREGVDPPVIAKKELAASVPDFTLPKIVLNLFNYLDRHSNMLYTIAMETLLL